MKNYVEVAVALIGLFSTAVIAYKEIRLAEINAAIRVRELRSAGCERQAHNQR